MNIYYINPKAPTVIPQEKVNIGDVCILEYADKLLVWVKEKENENLLENDSISVLHINPAIPDFKPQLAMIFSYDGINKRSGDKVALQILSKKIEDKDIKCLFSNTLNILDYKEDTIDAIAYLKVLSKRRFSFDIKEKISIRKNYYEDLTKKTEIPKTEAHIEEPIEQKKVRPSIMSHTPTEYRFYDYLDIQCQDTWNHLHKMDYAIRDIFKRIKTNNKSCFSNALRRYTKDFPELNIYSLKEKNKSEGQESLTIKSTYEKRFHFLYEALESNGFKRIANEKWRNNEGKLYIINIREVTE